MGLEITRHHFPVADPAVAMAPVVTSAEDVLSCIETSEFDRYDALDHALAVARWRCAEDPEAALRETWDAWVTAMRVGTALFISGASTDGPVTLLARNGDDLSELPATGPTPHLHAVNWLTAYYLAAVCRDNERLDLLARIPVSFLRASEVEVDEFVYAWVETLQNAWFGRAETWSTLRTAFDGTDPTVPGIASAELKVLISFPPMDLFYRYLLGEEEVFNAVLSDALTSHRNYWTAKEGRTLSSEGLVALAPLAVTCMAHDAGMAVQVRSEYLPKHLVYARSSR
ncbi:immunity 49 family protein [Streptomyces sp. NPDC048410]|uniref:immunity 49 family protein n=1 Tax=Streptomyces sp. NPDC048410 TaxID=3365545 RepID=UPI00371E97DF